jgi:flavodoxin
MSYCAYVTKIHAVAKHPNADRLQIGEVFGNHIIVDLTVTEGDLGVYFPTDGRVGIEFAKANNLLRKDENGNPMGGYLEYDKRHIKSIRLRGEQSDGLWISVKCLEQFTDINALKEGDTITTLNGVLICEKYVPYRKASNPNPTQKQKNVQPKESYPFFEQHLDTNQLAYNTSKFKEGDTCYITLKLHGTSQRTSHTIKKSIPTKLHKVLNIIGIKTKPKKAWELVSGTRRVTLSNYEGGYYGGNQFRKQWHDFFEGKLHKGESAYYEVVGYTEADQLIMPECDNKKTNDKAFIKQYGDKTRFTYGCGTGQNDVFVYRMTMTNEDGATFEYPTELVKLRCEQMAVKHVPILDKFIFTTREDLLERVKQYEDGADPIGLTHIREGIIVRIDNKEKFTAYKHKNFNFKVLEGIIKENDVLDIEEAESVEGEQQ